MIAWSRGGPRRGAHCAGRGARAERRAARRPAPSRAARHRSTSAAWRPAGSPAPPRSCRRDAPTPAASRRAPPPRARRPPRSHASHLRRARWRPAPLRSGSVLSGRGRRRDRSVGQERLARCRGRRGGASSRSRTSPSTDQRNEPGTSTAVSPAVSRTGSHAVARTGSRRAGRPPTPAPGSRPARRPPRATGRSRTRGRCGSRAHGRGGGTAEHLDLGHRDRRAQEPSGRGVHAVRPGAVEHRDGQRRRRGPGRSVTSPSLPHVGRAGCGRRPRPAPGSDARTARPPGRPGGVPTRRPASSHSSVSDGRVVADRRAPGGPDPRPPPPGAARRRRGPRSRRRPPGALGR